MWCARLHPCIHMRLTSVHCPSACLLQAFLFLKVLLPVFTPMYVCCSLVPTPARLSASLRGEHVWVGVCCLFVRLSVLLCCLVVVHLFVFLFVVLRLLICALSFGLSASSVCFLEGLVSGFRTYVCMLLACSYACPIVC